MRIYAEHISEYYDVLNTFPDAMKADIRKGGDCKKLAGLSCSPSCPAGYTFVLDGEKYKKCRNSAFFHSLTQENSEYIMKLIKAEV